MNAGIGNDLLKRLAELGICPEETRRVIIDIPYNDATTIYVEHINAKALLTLQKDDLKGVVIKEAGKETRRYVSRHCGNCKWRGLAPFDNRPTCESHHPDWMPDAVKADWIETPENFGCVQWEMQVE